MEQLEKYFDTAFGAPHGVKKLRELILTLSFQGKLTPRQTKGQSVSELLQFIESEKSKLIKSNKIKVKNTSNSNETNAGLYELPKGWRWARLRDISYDLGQKSPSSRFTYIDVGSVDNSAGMITDKVQILDSNEAPSRARKIVKEGTVIYSTVRPYLLNIAIVNQEYKPEPIASTAFAILHPYTGINKRYLYFYLRSPVFISFVEKLMKGVAYPAINDGDLFSGFIPLPPSKEQDEIVDKIDQLMSRCDDLEKLRAERDQKRLDVHTAAIRKMLDAPDQETFDDVWQFITRHFGDLYSVRENVAELRKAILQLAVMGKLVPQDPKEGTARELMEEIEREKRKMVKEGKMKEKSPMLPIKTSEIPYEIPKRWEWVRFGELFHVSSGTNLTKDNMIKGSFPVYGGNGITGYHNEFNVEKPTIVIGRVGYYCGSVHLTPSKAWVTDNAFTLYYNESKLNQSWLIWLLKTINLQTDTSGTAQPVISGAKIYPLLISLPPQKEQERIAQKINDVMNLCNILEEKIDIIRSKQGDVLGAVMADSLY
jgi:type I restriction enzyme S subunit